MRTAAGLYLNALNQALSPLVGVVSTMDAYYPATNMWDRRADVRARWSGADGSLNEKAMFDLNMLLNGNAESLTGWFALSGQLPTLNAATKLEGANSIQLSSTTTTPGILVSTPFKVRAGQAIAIMGGVYCSAGGNAGAGRGATLVLRNMATGLCWHQPTGLWTSALDYNNGYIIRTDTAAWTQPAGNIQTGIVIEGFAACGNQDSIDCRLELRTWQNAATVVTGLFDAMYVFPGVDFLGVFGFNGQPRNNVEWHYSTDGTWGAATKITDVTPFGQRVLWNLQGSLVYKRFQGLLLGGNDLSTYQQEEPMREVGELVLAQSTLLSTYPHYPIRIDGNLPSYRAVSPTGLPYATPLIGSGYAPSKLILHWEVLSLAEAKATRDEIWTRTREGTDPLVFLPTEVDPSVAIYGYAAADVTVQQLALNSWSVDLELKEAPLF